VLILDDLPHMPNFCLSAATFFVLLTLSGCSLSQPKMFCSSEKRFSTKVTNATISYTRHGTGRPVVYVHGAYGSANDFLLSPTYEEVVKSFETITYDRAGFGESKRSRWKTFTAEDHARTLHELIANLGLVKPIIIAHSWGGAVALSHAVEYPNDASSYLLLAPAAYDWGGMSGAWYDPIISFPLVGDLLVRSIGPLAVRSLSESALKFNFGDYEVPENYAKCSVVEASKPRAMIAQAKDGPTLISSLRKICRRYKEIKVPVTVIHGDRDNTVFLEIHSRPLEQTIDNLKLIVAKGAAHQPCYTHPKIVTEELIKLSKNSP
jgi:pimeloyl-ACP methyl ester carboxylesterase